MGKRQDLKLKVQEHSKNGEYVKAIPLMEQYVDLIIEEFGADSDRYVTVINDLGGMYRNVGDFNKAESTFNKALEITESKVGSQSIQYATITTNLACMYRFLNEFNKAEKLFLNAIDIYESNDMIKSLMACDKCVYTPEQTERAKELKKEILERSTLYANVCNNIGVLYQDMKDFEKALLYHNKSLELLNNTTNYEYIAITLNNFVNIFLQEKRYDDAIKVAQESLSILETHCTKEHPFYSTTLNNLGAIYFHQKQYTEALECFEEVKKDLKYTFGENSPQYASCVKNIEVVKSLIKE